MASILNVRDVNNNVVHIPAIRGEKGDPTDLTVVPSKGSVVDGDGFLIADSADSKSSKLLLWSTIKAIFASRIVPAAAGNLATLDANGNLADSGKLPTYFQQATDGLTAETTLDDTDVIPFYDASATAHRKSTWANLKAKIKSALFGTVNGIPKLDGSGTVSAADAASLKTLLDTLTAVSPATDDKIPLTDISGGIAGYSTIANILALATPGAQIATGSYTGNGLYGSANPCSLTFPFPPKIVIIFFKSQDGGTQYFNWPYFGMFFGGWNYGNMFGFPVNYSSTDPTQSSSTTSAKTALLIASWTNNGETMSWYQKNDSDYQLNSSGFIYHWGILG